ncbi:metal ABC transporter permease [Shewanella sp. NIFS-20-20]|uniref:metal ABC transporter permease n=1 Tax=Shewanella sp. NIFS-20-20 TaxID=2853806 RepID=UPI001C48C5E6|nr:metal ABC transporter permease [Shewanella sp. NIFS-20-20]MBV7316198.1 metal ABC transporter permease [Shewanella sp. NIFS-20-20]
MDSALLLILLPALAAGLLVLATHVVLGRQVLKRGIIFIDLAIAQVAALGTVMMHHSHVLSEIPLATWWMPALFALAGAGLIAWLAQHCRDELEAIIGCIYVVSAAAAMLLLANDPHGGELLKQVLSGQILWVNWSQLVVPALVSVLLLLLWAYRPSVLYGSYFYYTFAIVITLSVELVGVYLVFSSLILPALAVNRLSHYWWLNAYAVGVSAYVVGLGLSTVFDVPAGATIVLCLALFAVIFRLWRHWLMAKN